MSVGLLGGAGRHVLVVDDDAGVRQALVDILTDEGHRVSAARHGAEALELLRTAERPDVIVLDLTMPVMDGWTFREHQRQDPALAGIPLIVMSAASARGRKVDANRVLAKPVDIDVLLESILAV